MNGTALAGNQSSNRIEKRKLVSITRSPSVAVVSEIAPRWITASSLRPFSQSASSAGGTMSASWRLARLRHLPSWPSRSQTTTSWRPASFNAATTFDPIKPAPPVTSNMPVPASIIRRHLCPTPARRATGLVRCGEERNRLFQRFTSLPGAATDGTGARPASNYEQKFNSSRSRRYPADPDRPLHVDRRFRARPHGGAGPEGALAQPAGGPLDHLALRPLGRLHAGRPESHSGRPAPQPAGGGQAAGAGRGAAPARLRHGAGAAPHLEGGDCPGAGRHP